MHNATITPENGEDEAGTPGDMRKGGLEVRISKETKQDDAVEWELLLPAPLGFQNNITCFVLGLYVILTRKCPELFYLLSLSTMIIFTDDLVMYSSEHYIPVGS